ncbi:MAG: hypothetical protein HQM08_24600 [Candidatus Riflebacteria bacterium]|nr:hypothetical protein [Candidatus Riflebacteria bacterium]
MKESSSLENGLTLISNDRKTAFFAGISFFLIISAYYILKPIRESLALEIGPANIPALNVLSMFSLLPANALYSWIVANLDRKKFFPLIFYGSIISLVLFFIVFLEMSQEINNSRISFSRKTAITIYYVWVNLFALFSVSVFWSFLNDIFTLQEGERLYSFIGYGGLLGGLFGGVSLKFLIAKVGTSKMLIVAALFLLPVVWLFHIMEKLKPSQEKKVDDSQNFEEKTKSAINSGASALSGLHTTFASNFLILMALETFLNTFGNTVFSYKINELVEQNIAERDLRTQFWADNYNLINLLSIVTQFFLTSTILQCSYPWIGLMLLPIIQIAGSTFLLFSPILSIAVWCTASRYAVNYSAAKAVRELFFIPLSRQEKYQAKGFIDTVVFRSGDGLASSLLLAGISLFGPGKWIDFLVIVVMVLLVLVIQGLGSHFKKSVKK